jgi:hypothetical protein
MTDLTRREAIAVISSFALGTTVLPNTPENKLLSITYRLDNLRNTLAFDLTNYHSENDMFKLHQDIWHGLYFKNGNASGVYEKINYQNKEFNLEYADDVKIGRLAGLDFCPSFYRKNSDDAVCQFSCNINEQYSLRMNRFWIAIDDNVKKHCFVGSGQTDSGPNGDETLTLNGKHGRILYNDQFNTFLPTTKFANLTPDGTNVYWTDVNGNLIDDPYFSTVI